MPVVQLQPTSSGHDNQTTVQEVLAKPNQSNFTTLFPEATAGTLLKYVEGYPWTVHYYGQILNTANGVSHFDNTSPALLGPVQEIRDLVLQVTSPLSSTYDESTGVTTITGSALSPFKVVPNMGDCFIANVDSGEDGIFVVNSVIRKTHRKETLYEINYALLKYVNADPAFLTALRARVQDSYFFNKDTNFFNRDVLVTPVVKEATDMLKSLLRDSQAYYFQTFPQWELGSLLLPGTDDTYYDPLLKDFIQKTVDLPPEIGMRFYSYSYSDRYIGKQSFFDMLKQRNIGLHSVICKQYGFASTASLRNNMRFDNIYHTQIRNIIYPKTPDKRADVRTMMPIGPSEILSPSPKTVNNYSLGTLTVQTISNNSLFTKPLLHELFVNDYYVVSENFYTYLLDNSTYESISYFELLLSRFIQHEAIAREDLVFLLRDYHKWSLLHQFYLLPLAWLMVKVNL